MVHVLSLNSFSFSPSFPSLLPSSFLLLPSFLFPFSPLFIARLRPSKHNRISCPLRPTSDRQTISTPLSTHCISPACYLYSFIHSFIPLSSLPLEHRHHTYTFGSSLPVVHFARSPSLTPLSPKKNGAHITLPPVCTLSTFTYNTVLSSLSYLIT